MRHKTFPWTLTTKATALMSLLAMSFCAPPPKHSDFTAVSKILSERTGQQTDWHQAEDQVIRTVETLLAQPLDAHSAVQIALLNNPSIHAQLEELGISQAQLLGAGLLENPSLHGSFRVPSDSSLQINVGIELVQNLLDLLMRPARKEMASLQLTQTTFKVAHELLALISETRLAIYEAQAAQQRLALQKKILQAEAASEELTRRIHHAGNLSKLEYAHALDHYQHAHLEYLASESHLLQLREVINQKLGLWGTQTQWKLAAELPPLPIAEPTLHHLEAHAVKNRLDLAQMRSEMDLQALALGVELQWRYLPLLELGIDGEVEPDGERVMGPVIALELPIFNRGQARIREAEARLSVSEHQLKARAIDIRAEVRRLRDLLARNRMVAEYFQTSRLPLKRQILGLSQEEFNYMLIGPMDLLEAKNDELETEREAVDALLAYWVTHTLLEQTLGGSFPKEIDPAHTSSPASPTPNQVNGLTKEQKKP